MLNTKQQSAFQGIECIIRVKDGNLAPRGKGTFTMGVMPDGKVALRATLPSANGVPEPFDLMSFEQLEMVKTRTGWYQGNKWIKPTMVVLGAAVGPAIILSLFMPVLPPSSSFSWAFDLIFQGAVVTTVSVGGTFPALVYAGSKLPRIARFVFVTHDGRYCVAEMPEAAFRFLQGVKAGMNQHI